MQVPHYEPALKVGAPLLHVCYSLSFKSSLVWVGTWWGKIINHVVVASMSTCAAGHPASPTEPCTRTRAILLWTWQRAPAAMDIHAAGGG